MEFSNNTIMTIASVILGGTHIGSFLKKKEISNRDKEVYMMRSVLVIGILTTIIFQI